MSAETELRAQVAVLQEALESVPRPYTTQVCGGCLTRHEKKPAEHEPHCWIPGADAALAATSADALERVRREALEEAAVHFENLPFVAVVNIHHEQPGYDPADILRALKDAP